MAIVLSILRKAHAKGTHHRLALDAVGALDANLAGRATWERLFYKHIALFVDGAKAPDNAFKDFENHVLHPRHKFWGGAIGQVETWYEETVEALKRQDWPAAVYAAGVLSHYVTDPLQPLHTHQTEAENAIHAAVEWSVSRSYPAMIAAANGAPVATPSSTISLAQLMRAGAEAATAHYETVLAHYDIKRGVVSPEEGFDALGARVMGERLVAARVLYAHILSRALRAAGVVPVEVSLAGDAVKAFLSLPAARRARHKLDTADRQLVEAMYDELMATGRVEKTLPEDERKIRDLFATVVAGDVSVPAVPAVVVAPAPAAASAATAAPSPAAPHEAMAPPDDLDPEDPAGSVPLQRQRVAIEPARPAPPLIEAPHARPRATVAADEAVPLEAATVAAPEAPSPAVAAAALASTVPVPPAANTPVLSEIKPVQIEPPPSARITPALASYRPSAGSGGRGVLSLDADVVDAPSIGAKTAHRLNAVGIDTVSDFLKAHPIALAARLEHPALTATVLTEWQDQTRLMVTLGGLRAADAKLLVGSGYRTVDAITNVEPDQLSADVLRFALTAEGQSLLRDGHVPDVEKIRGWALEARAVKAA